MKEPPVLVYVACTTTLAFAFVAQAEKANSADDGGGWPLWSLCLCCAGTVLLSAMYCGLTIGLLGMDTITLEIIAEAGPEPDKTYASQILPIRKLGHQLLSTLLLGNMLTLVLSSQLVNAIVQGTELVNFISGTLIIFIFGEILPISYCSNGDNALMAGSRSLPALQISIILLYPIAKPLGMLLDYLIIHDAGQLYDRRELKQLISVHCDKYSDRTGIDAEQLCMMLSALEMNEVDISAVMTPMDKVFFLRADVRIDKRLEEQLWTYGKSRIPVFEGTRDRIIGVLHVKDLLSASLQIREQALTVKEFLQEHPRDTVAVSSSMRLCDTLHIFATVRSQLLFVVDDHHISKGEMLANGTEPFTVASPTALSPSGTPRPQLLEDPTRFECCGGVAMRFLSSTVLHSKNALEYGVGTQHRFVGIITLEDVIEHLISSEIYDEDECSDMEVVEDGSRCASKTLEGRTGFQAPATKQKLPRVNFYSYGVPANDGTPYPLTNDQVLALARYLINTYSFFALWAVADVQFLIQHVGDRVLFVDETSPDTNTISLQTEGLIGSLSTESVQADGSASSYVLYLTGTPSDAFTLILSGCVRLKIGGGKFTSELRSFAALGETVLSSSEEFVPDYTAVVSQTTRFLRLTRTAIANVQAILEKRREGSTRPSLDDTSEGLQRGSSPTVTVKSYSFTVSPNQHEELTDSAPLFYD